MCILAEMFSVEAEREAERREREELALKKDDVRRKIKKYDRLHGQTKSKVGHFMRRACCFNSALKSLISDAVADPGVVRWVRTNYPSGN